MVNYSRLKSVLFVSLLYSSLQQGLFGEPFQIIRPYEVKTSLEQLVISKVTLEGILEDTLSPYFDYTSTEADLAEGCGALFYGPPGTGKTTLAKALAKQLNLPIILSSGPSMQGFYIGEGATLVRNLFEEARQQAPCIVVIDEIDSISKQRGLSSLANCAQMFDLTTNELLAQMDCCNNLPFDRRVFIIGTTNFTEGHDSALTRPGRMSKMIKFDNPSDTNRRKLINFYWTKHLKTQILSPQFQDLISQTTEGESPAVIEALVKSLVRKVNKGEQITVSAVVDAALSTSCGKIDTDAQQECSTECKKMVAMHEAGHTIAGFLYLGNPVKLFKYVSIEPRTGGSGGLTYFTNPSLESSFKEDLEGIVAMNFGGGLGEELHKGTTTHSTGVASDYMSINKTLSKMCDLGMLPDVTSTSDHVSRARAIDKKFFEIQNQVREKFATPAVKAAITALANELVKKNVLDCSQVISIPQVTKILQKSALGR